MAISVNAPGVAI